MFANCHVTVKAVDATVKEQNVTASGVTLGKVKNAAIVDSICAFKIATKERKGKFCVELQLLYK